MNAALFKHRITFLSLTTVKDDLGQDEGIYQEFKTVWAMIKTMKGSEYLAAASAQAELTYRFIIRYTPGISTNMQINYKGRIFDIIEPPINDDEANKTLTILAKEKL